MMVIHFMHVFEIFPNSFFFTANDNSDDTPPKWMTESDKEALFRAGVKFMDITDYPNPPVSLNSAWQPGK